MRVAIDVGNTRIKAAVFDGDDIVRTRVLTSLEAEEIHELVLREVIDGVIVSSVRSGLELPRTILDMPVLALDHHTPLPIETRYDTPETLGRDRLAAVVGAHHIFPGHCVLVIDAGTCVTYDYVSKEGYHAGGNIAPGLKMRLRAMFEMTDGLPKVDPPESVGWFGRTTFEAMQLGAVRGILSEMDGYRRRVEAVEGSVKMVITGGDAEYLAEMLETKIFVRPNLVLRGLNEILKFNAA